MSHSINCTVSTITRDMRRKELGHPAGVIWFTGLSGSGKSTLAMGLEVLLHQQNIATYVLDGDHLRHGLCSDLGFSDHDRRENMRRTGEVAKLFAEAGLVVLCALISPFSAEREHVRHSCLRDQISFIEVFVDTPLAVCERRDPRGLYAKARAGKMIDFTGIHSPYEAPTKPDLCLSTHHCSSNETLRELHDFVAKWLARIVPTVHP